MEIDLGIESKANSKIILHQNYYLASKFTIWEERAIVLKN